MPELFSLTIFQWNSSLEETSSSQINFFFLKQYTPSRQIQNILKNFVELVSILAVLNLSTSKCHVSCFFTELVSSRDEFHMELVFGRDKFRERLYPSLVSKQYFFAKLF
jgi:hypothetical protein